jgi:hypothetical protein
LAAAGLLHLKRAWPGPALTLGAGGVDARRKKARTLAGAGWARLPLRRAFTSDRWCVRNRIRR